MYLPHAQSGRWLPHMTVALRARATAGLAEAVRRQVHAVDPDTPVYGLEPMARLVERSVATRRFQTMLLGSLRRWRWGWPRSGLYGVLAQAVAQRRREVGIRMAVGARRADVVWLVVRQGLALALAGVAPGAGRRVGALTPGGEPALRGRRHRCRGPRVSRRPCS